MAFPPLTQEELIELWRRMNPPSYTVPIEDEQNGQGFDIPSAQAEIFALADREINQTFQAHYLKPSPIQTAPPASGAAKATTTVELTRVAGTVGGLSLDVGTLLIVEQIGSLGQTIELVDFELLADVVLPEGDAGPIVANVRAAIEGYVGNVVAGSIVGFRDLGRAAVTPCDVDSTTVLRRITPAPGAPVTDRFTLGMLGRFCTLVGLPSGVGPPVKIVGVDVVNQSVVITPALAAGDVAAGGVTVEVAEMGDLGVRVSQPADATGGLIATLDAIGADRKAGRVVGEPDEPYRERLCTLDDTISPDAIESMVADILAPCGIDFRIKETRDVATLKGFVWDLDPFDFGQIAPVPNNGVGDLVGEGAVLLSQGSAFTYFLICVGIGNDGEFGAAYDAAAVGMTPPNAWSQFFWDGQPVEYLSCIGQLVEAVNGARAAGVGFNVVQDPGLT